MLTSGGDVFVLIPDGSEHRVLHKGTVTECSPTAFVAHFEEQLTPEPGTAVFAHAEVNRRFMQQGASVTAVLESEPGTTLAFELSGQPISADSRHAFRVSVAAACLLCAVAEDAKCVLLDVSATGFGVSSRSKFVLGENLRATLNWKGKQYSGPARIQSVRETGGSSVRYGLHAVEGAGRKPTELQRGLGEITAAAQRDQLRRLARA